MFALGEENWFADLLDHVDMNLSSSSSSSSFLSLFRLHEGERADLDLYI